MEAHRAGREPDPPGDRPPRCARALFAAMPYDADVYRAGMEIIGCLAHAGGGARAPGLRRSRARDRRRRSTARRRWGRGATSCSASSRSACGPRTRIRRLRSRMRRRVTFSRNVTLSLSRTCVSHCKYCAFATHQPHLHAPDEVERLIDGAARRNVKELLVLTGDDPAYHPGVRERLAELGFADFVAYVAWCCERALERGAAAAHEPRRARPRRSRAAARGDRQPGADDRVDPAGPRRPPGVADQGPGAAARARCAPPMTCGSRSRAASSSGSARPRTTGWRRWRRSPASATCRRSSCRTSSRTGATTARSRRRSRPRRRRSTGAPACTTDPTSPRRRGRRRSRSTTWSGSCARRGG